VDRAPYLWSQVAHGRLPHINQNVGWMLRYARQYDEEIEQYNRALELDPDFLFARRRLCWAFSSKGMHDAAISECEKVIAIAGRTPTAIGALGITYARAGRRDEARKILSELQVMQEHGYVPAYIFAQMYNGIGNRRAAFEWLEKAFEERSYATVFLKVTDDFDESFRQDERFREILRQLKVA
jgi:tetratricopeptide (TPR) repeat protein